MRFRDAKINMVLENSLNLAGYIERRIYKKVHRGVAQFGFHPVMEFNARSCRIIGPINVERVASE